MNWKKFLQRYNGWLGFLIATVIFFVAPPIYRLLDPTAGQLDAGYIHPIVYAMVVVCIASGIAWMLSMFTAPGPHKALDNILEDHTDPYTALYLYSLFFIGFVGVVIAMI